MERIISDKRIFFAGFGAIGGLLSGLANAFSGLHSESGSAIASWVVGTGFDGLFIAALLGLSQGWYVGKSFDLHGLAKTSIIGGVGGLIGGFAALFLGFPISELLGGGDNIARFIGWTFGGLAVGFAVSRVIPNLKTMTSCTAGAIGGFIGCGLMYVIGSLTIGIATTGAAIGLTIAFAESAFRQAWLEVTIRPRGMSLSKERTLTVTLGESPVLFGCGADSDVRLDEIAGAKPNFARVTFSRGSVTLHDLATEKTRVLSVNDSFEVSNATVVLRAKFQ